MIAFNQTDYWLNTYVILTELSDTIQLSIDHVFLQSI